MNRFKIRFLAVIAVAAVSFTVIDYNMLITKNIDPTYCFLKSSNTTGKQVRNNPLNCTNFVSPFTPVNTIACSNAIIAYEPKLTAPTSEFKIVLLDQIGALTPQDQLVDCPSKSGEFCCFFLTQDNQPCIPTQPLINIGGIVARWKITEVRCRPL